jgi:hypothetical protein
VHTVLVLMMEKDTYLFRCCLLLFENKYNLSLYLL